MHLLGIDFEDWYHPQLVAPFISEKQKTPTMHLGLDKILDLLRKNDSKATFFLVGEILDNNPEISDKILDGGHEIGFHTMRHTRLDSPNFRPIFVQELRKFESIISKRVIGFRAPTFSINEQNKLQLNLSLPSSMGGADGDLISTVLTSGTSVTLTLTPISVFIFFGINLNHYIKHLS